MTETFLALVPEYGTYIVVLVVFLACLAVPLPASVLVLTAGSFAATGDLSLATVGIGVLVAFIAGDQFAFWIASRAGRSAINHVRSFPSMAPVLAKSEDLLGRRGALAVLISHTVASPTCPYISYLSGAGGLSWTHFTLAAVPGAMIWTAVYLGLGMTFATQLEQVIDILGNFFGVVLAGSLLVGLFLVLHHRWQERRR